MTKGLIIFIGECFRTGGHGSRARDTPESINAQHAASLTHVKLINNIKEKYNMEIDVAINSYKTNNQDLLLNWYNNNNLTIIFSNFIDAMIGQEALINIALHNEKLANITCYEFIFICRIDLFLKDLMFELFNPYSQKLTFPSVCWVKDCVCNNMPRVNDTMLFIPKQMLNNDFIVNKKVSFKHESWFIYVHDYKLNFYDLTVYLDTYHDSDSAKDFNPLYYMIGRQESSIWHSIAYILNRNTMQPKLDLVTQVDYMKGIKNMALLLVGLHYKENYTAPCIPNSTGDVDFRLHVKNIKTKVLDYFNKFYNIDTYISTNNSNYLNEMLKIYNPYKFFIDDRSNRIFKTVKILKLLMDEINKGKQYDYIAITRLDIYFLMDFSNIEFYKFNIISILEKNDVCDDNFYFFPVNFLHKFYDLLNNKLLSIQSKDPCVLHYLHHDIYNHFPIHYIHNQNRFVADLDFYKLRYFFNCNLILNKNDFSDNVWYNSCNNNSSMLIDNNIINFKKNNKHICGNCWIGYVLSTPGFHNISFNIYSDKDIINYDFIKVHNPIKLYKTENIYANTWTKINITIETSYPDDLLCLIFDNFDDFINIKYKDLFINNNIV